MDSTSIKMSNSIYKCSFEGCKSTFRRTFTLYRHIRAHKGERPFICTIGECEKAFTCRSYLNKHMKRPHNDGNQNKKREKKKYVCDECKKSFKNKFLLKTHSSEHTGIKPFKCDECDSSFALRSRLVRHKKRHRGYPCDKDNCKMIAQTWSQLRKHISVNHKPIYSCMLCSKVLLSKASLNKHIKAHKFNCSYENCSKSFIRKSHLDNHVLIEHNTHPFVCDFERCNQRFSQELTFYQHKLAHLQTNDTAKSGRERKTVFSCRKSLAQTLSGYQANNEDLAIVFNNDKDYRREIQT